MNILRSLGVALLATTPLFTGCDGHSAKHTKEVGWAKKHAERERQEALKEKLDGPNLPQDRK